MDDQIDNVKSIVKTFKEKRGLFENLGLEKVNRSLIITGAEGSGKTNLAYAIAAEMNLPTKVIHCKRGLTSLAIEFLSSIAN